MEHLIDALDAHGGVAAWVQAIGAIIALALTIYLSRVDRTGRKRSALVRGRSAALAIFPIFVDVFTKLELALENVSKGRSPEGVGQSVPASDELIAFWSAPVLPASLKAMSPLLHELGEAAEASQKAYFALYRLQLVFRPVDSETQGGESLYSLEEWRVAYDYATKAKDLLKEAITLISEYLM